ncbi:MAG: pantoate--beta-alanine ligase [Actinomycetota bacterium]
MTTEVLTTIAAVRDALDGYRADGRTVGFTPTMGYLHDGHGSLMRAADADTDVVVASIFVNPLQFAAGEDLADYPRDFERDLELAAANGVDLLFHPPVEEMYPFGPVLTTVSVGEVSERWDGASRPTHFAGVATVVAKLFNIIGPCLAYFGDKDFQQLAVIRRMVEDLSIPVEVVGCPIVREPDGLAMSSRNTYLSPEDRAAAIVLRRALDAGRAAHGAGTTDPTAVADAMTDVVAAEPRAVLDYVAVVDPTTLRTAEVVQASTRLLIAATLGTTRLIDNDAAGPTGPPAEPQPMETLS